MTLLNDRELYAATTTAFGDLGVANCTIMGAICLAESGGETTALGDNYQTGHQPENSPYRWDRGLAQINSIHGYEPERLLEDPLYNLACARAIWNRQGFPAWSTFKGGQFREFLGRMEIAAGSFDPPHSDPQPAPFGVDDLRPLWLQLYGYEQGVRINPVSIDPSGRRIYELVMPA